MQAKEAKCKSNNKYYIKNCEKLKKKAREYHKNNSEFIKEYRKEYYQKNREKLLEKQKEYYKGNAPSIKGNVKKWVKNNREKRRIYVQNHYKNNVEKYREYAKKHRIKTKMQALEHYGGAPPECKCCGEKHIEFLTMDHIDGGGRKHREEIGSGKLYIWLRQNNYPNGFRVLCMNCNNSMGHSGYCPHGGLDELQKRVA